MLRIYWVIARAALRSIKAGTKYTLMILDRMPWTRLYVSTSKAFIFCDICHVKSTKMEWKKVELMPLFSLYESYSRWFTICLKCSKYTSSHKCVQSMVVILEVCNRFCTKLLNTFCTRISATGQHFWQANWSGNIILIWKSNRKQPHSRQFFLKSSVSMPFIMNRYLHHILKHFAVHHWCLNSNPVYLYLKSISHTIHLLGAFESIQ